MFSESGNIQARPTPTLYERRGWSVRTFNEYAHNAAASLVAAVNFPVIVNGGPFQDGPAVNEGATLRAAVYFAPIVSATFQDGPAVTEGATLRAAVYLDTLYTANFQDGPAVTEGATLTGATYFLAIVAGSPSSDQPLQNNAAELLSATYA